tara:strand:- start:159 stop:428 length:270 start_codon:yes stop_codon:yes gene_type:complete
MSKVLMCDPPSGWKYGFPKPVPLHVDIPRIVRRYSRCAGASAAQRYGIPSDAFDRQILQWLVSDGYPQSEIDDYGDYFYCRFYEMEVIE